MWPGIATGARRVGSCYERRHGPTSSTSTPPGGGGDMCGLGIEVMRVDHLHQALPSQGRLEVPR